MAGLALAIAIPASAQQLSSTYFMETGNFNHQLNPALLKQGNVGFLLSNFNLGVGTNIGLTNFIYDNPDYGVAGKSNSMYRYTTFMHPGISTDKFIGDLPENTRFGFDFNMNILSVAFKAFKGVNLVEINLRSQTATSLPRDFFKFMKTAGSAEQYSFSDLALRSQTYAELALGHSHKINDKITVGGKVKVLFGGALVDFKANNFDITMTGEQWAIKGDAEMVAAAGDITLQGKDAYGNITIPANPGDEFDDIDEFKPGIAGLGVAFDFGATYEPIKNLTISAAVTDIGFINWKNAQKAVSTAEWDFDGFDDIYVGSNDNNKDLGEQFEDLGDELEDVFTLEYAGKGKKRQALAATLNLGVEYKLPMYDKLKFGFLYSGRMSKIYRNHQTMLSAGIRPVKFFEFLANINCSTYGWSYGGILSLHAKHFNFHVGAQAPFSKFSKEYIPLDALNAHVNFGLTFPL